MSLAKRHGSRLHVLHITTAKELDLFTPGPLDGKRITAEACVHHLFFNDTWYAPLGADIKCNPAIKSRADQLALKQAVKEDRIDVIATDHAPHTRQEKSQRYLQAPAGLPLVQHALLTLIEQVKAGELTIEQVVHKTAHAPARLFDVRDRGFVREGCWADLAVVDPERGDGGGRRTAAREMRLDALSRHDLPLADHAYVRERRARLARRPFRRRFPRDGAGVRALGRSPLVDAQP